MGFDEKLFDIVDLEKDPYKYYREKFVEVIGNSSRNYWGVYRGLSDHRDIILFPSIVGEFHKKSVKSVERDNVLGLVEEPILLNYQSIESMSPVREEYVRLRVEESRQGLSKKSSLEQFREFHQIK
jgi:hypothetical protein